MSELRLVRSQPTEEIEQEATLESRPTLMQRWRGKIAVGALLVAGGVSFSIASGIDAIALGTPEHIEMAGQDVGVKPKSQNYSNIDGVLIFEDHTSVLGKDVGLSVNTDLNNLVPQNKQQRTALKEFWQDPEPQVDRIRAAGTEYVTKWGGGGATGGLIAFSIAAGIGLHQRHKYSTYDSEHEALVRAHNRPLKIVGVAAVGIVVSGVYGGSAYTLTHSEHHTVIPDASLSGTPLAGTEVRGLAKKIVPLATGLFDPRQKEFYDTAEADLKKTIQNRPELQPDTNEIAIVAGDDPQGVGGMLRLMGDYAAETDASSVYLPGDLTDFGTSLETYLLDDVTYYSDHTPVFATQGPHETDTIVRAEEDNDDFTVADNKIHEDNGLRILGLNDPRVSTVGQFGTSYELRNPDTSIEDFVANAVQEVCSEHPQLVVLHDHDLAEKIISQAQSAGCALPFVLTGRSYNFIGPQYIESADKSQTTTEFILGSAGGHIDTDPHPGIVESTATFMQLLLNKETGMVHYTVISLTPQGKLTISQPINLSVPYADYLKNGRTEPKRINIYKNKPKPPLAGVANGRH